MKRMVFPRVVWVIAVAFAVTGCGGDGNSARSTVSGKVNYKGAPLKEGRLSIANKSAGNVYHISNGMFEGEAPSPGEYVVTVNGDPIERQGKTPAKSPIPLKYKDASKSGLTWSITAGRNEKEFDLTD